jgi:hypothetical protein
MVFCRRQKRQKKETLVHIRSGTRMMSRPLGWRLLFLHAAAFLVVGIFASRNLATWSVRLRYPGEEDTIEGVSLAEMVRLRAGVPIYAAASTRGFDSSIYGPLHYLLGSRLIKPQTPGYYNLRVLSMLAVLVCAAGVALLAFWSTESYFAAGVAPLLFVGFAHGAALSLSARSDLTAVALVFSGFLVAYRFRRSRLILLACPLLLIGLFFKEQFVAAPLAILLFLVLERRYRVAAEFAGILSVGGLALLAFFELTVFRGQSILLHLITYGRLPLSLRRFGIFSIYFAATILPLLLAAIENLRIHRDKLVSCYLACSVLLSLFMVSRVGSSLTYFVEVTIILSPLLAALVWHSITIGSVPDAIALLVLLGITLGLGDWKVAHPYPRSDDFAADRTEQAFLRREFPGGAPGLGLSGDLTRAGLATPISDFFLYSWLVCEGRIPETELVGQIRHKQFAVILLPVNLQSEQEAHSETYCLTESVHRAILDNYQTTATFSSESPREESYRHYAWVPLPHAPASR